MSQTPSHSDTGQPEGQSWSFMNDVRLVGELTKVVCTIASGAIFRGWAKIVAHRGRSAFGGITGMFVAGPVFSDENRDTILDPRPLFVRADRNE